jgi:hypothetical protein
LRRSLSVCLLVLGCAGLQPGCAAIGITLAGSAAATAAGVGSGYALESITYKTFTASLTELTAATIVTLERMDIKVVENEQTESGRTIFAKAGDRDIDIELDRLTSRVTRMRVIAKMNWLLRDRATATEIILQADRTLTDHPSLATVKPAPAPEPPPSSISTTPAATPIPPVTPERDSQAAEATPASALAEPTLASVADMSSASEYEAPEMAPAVEETRALEPDNLWATPQ